MTSPEILKPTVLLGNESPFAFTGRIEVDGADPITRGVMIAALLGELSRLEGWSNRNVVPADGDALNVHISSLSQFRAFVGLLRALNHHLTQENSSLKVRCFLAATQLEVRSEVYEVFPGFSRATLNLLNRDFLAAVRAAQRFPLLLVGGSVELFFASRGQKGDWVSFVDKHGTPFSARPSRISLKTFTKGSPFPANGLYAQPLSQHVPLEGGESGETNGWVLIKIDRNNASKDLNGPETSDFLARQMKEMISVLGNLGLGLDLRLVEQHEEAAYMILSRDRLPEFQERLAGVNLPGYKMIAYSIPEPQVVIDTSRRPVHLILPVDREIEACLEQRAKKTGHLEVDPSLMSDSSSEL